MEGNVNYSLRKVNLIKEKDFGLMFMETNLMENGI
jgi:hypothetical protein